MRDVDIRAALVARLHTTHAASVPYRLWEEMPVALGAARVDVAVINSRLAGFEIKSDRDSLARLPNQVDHYSRCLDYVTIVCGQRHLSRSEEMIPTWWGLTEAREDRAGNIRLVSVRRPKVNRSIDAFYVAQLLRRDEAFDLLRQHGAHIGLASATRWTLWDTLAATIPVEELRRQVRMILCGRTVIPDS